ncbi:MAG: polyribonucleotide nucleotidyltransferase [Acidobacteriota bacterium]
MIEKVSLPLEDAELSIETGRVAKEADGAALVRYADTVVLVTACAAREPKEDCNFLPLTCDYREYTYAAGKIPGGFFKREGRPTEKEILTSRLIDRPVRPLFPDNYCYETQIIAMVLSAEPERNPDVLALVGASAALCCSDIAFHHTLGSVRVGLVEDRLVLNPTFEQLQQSDLNLVVSATKEAIVMVEAGAREVSEEKVVEGLEFGHQAICRIIEKIEELAARLNRTKREVAPRVFDPEIERAVEEYAAEPIREALRLSGTAGKLASERKMKAIKKETVELFPEEDAGKRSQAETLFSRVKEKVFRAGLLGHQERPDGRAFDEIRPISSQVALLPRTHGSALFTRGETQALVTVTLGTAEDVQRLDDLRGESSKTFMLHYNFPPFSVGEVRFLRGPGRREIGHGALAEKAILPLLPAEQDFPYTVRVVSDILESNGSSSMATICGAVLALQDAGVPIGASIAGIAMGLVKEGDQYAILSDIAGAEDHYGDMDFKVAGSRKGITALQMDIKITGVTREILAQALEQARRGRLAILDRMAETIAEPRSAISLFAPRIVTMNIPVAKIGGVIGPGGKMIRSIIEQTGVKIDIEDDGVVKIFSIDDQSAQDAIKLIEEITATAEVGKTYLGKVIRVMDFGAFVEILPGTEGLLHISEIANRRIRDIHDEVKSGDKILVKVLNIDAQNKIRLSRKAVLEEQRGGSRSGPQGRRPRGNRQPV